MTETGALTASMTFNYLAGDVVGNEATYVLIRATAGQVPQRFPNVAPCPGAGSPCVDTIGNTIFAAGVQSFENAWTAGELLAPTAANAVIRGRVLNREGRGVAGSIVYVADGSGNVRNARTSSFGYYIFEDLAVGQTYVVAVRDKRFQFTPRVINLSDDVADVDFVPQE